MLLHPDPWPVTPLDRIPRPSGCRNVSPKLCSPFLRVHNIFSEKRGHRKQVKSMVLLSGARQNQPTRPYLVRRAIRWVLSGSSEQ